MNFKQIKKDWKKQKCRLYLILLVSISIFSFFSGIHQIDLCRNELSIEHDVNELLKDKKEIYRFYISETTGGGLKYSIKNGQCHKVGLNLTFVGYILSLATLLGLIIKKEDILN